MYIFMWTVLQTQTDVKHWNLQESPSLRGSHGALNDELREKRVGGSGRVHIFHLHEVALAAHGRNMLKYVEMMTSNICLRT